MPVPGFLASFADKAQSAINASPLAGHVPNIPGGHGPAHGANRPSSPDPAPQPTANDAAAQGGAKSHTLEALSYQFRALQQQYGSTTPVQKIITIEKGVAMDFDNVSRDSKAQSKEMYTWGQNEAEDLKDVTDRLAYLNFVQGSLASSLAGKFEGARVPLKALRDAETNLQPRRNIRLGIQSQIAKLEHDQSPKVNEPKIAQLRDQLRKAESDDVALEKEVEVLKRKAIRESEQIKWDAVREYGEKLVLLAQAATPIVGALPPIPPSAQSPYTGHATTGAVRASLQRALDNYKTGHINLPPQANAADLTRSDTQSFGESHASELSSIHSDVGLGQGSRPTSSAGSGYGRPSPKLQSVPMPLPTHGHGPAQGHGTPLAAPQALPNVGHGATSPPPHQPSPPSIDPSALNQTPVHLPQPVISPSASSGSPPAPASVGSLAAMPVPVPSVGTTGPTSAEHPPSTKNNSIPSATPTVAETGVPVSAGPDGPGPASGSLYDIKVHPKHESAEEEKRRLREMYSGGSAGASAGAGAAAGWSAPPPAATTTTQAHHESAEEEKKRLEREERERILHSGAGPGKPDDDLPPYQEPGLQ